MRFLRCLALAVFASWAGSAGAVGFGDIRVLSNLGQPLNASVPLIGSDTADLTSTCIKTRLQSADGAALGNALVAISRGQRGAAILLSTRQGINEPAIQIEVNITCGPLVHRDFSILLDPIGLLPAVTDTEVVVLPRTENVVRPRERLRVRRSRNRIDAPPDQGDTGAAQQQSEPVVARGTTVSKATKSPPPPLAVAKALAPRKSVLKLSNEGFTDAEMASMGHLKLSASIADTAPLADAKERDALQAARNRFAQVLRGEDATQVLEADRVTDLQQIARLKAQVSAIAQQRASDRAALLELKKQSLPLGWAVAMLCLLMLSLLVAGWLVWRLVLAKKQTASAWDMALANQDPSHDLAVSTAAVPSVFAHVGSPASRIDSRQNPEIAAKTESSAGHLNEPAFTKSDLTERSVPIPTKTDAAAINPIAPTVVASVAAVAAVEAMQFHSSKIEHLKVEEISDVMQEAEFWMSLNDPVRAMEILEPYANLEAPDSPMPWLYLLDLYRGVDERLKYMLLQEKAARVFNARIPTWDEDGDATDGRTLEDFPHVVEKICTLWETPDIFDYLESLIFNKREEIREGFDLAVYQEIMLLMAMARSTGRDRETNPFGDSKKRQLTLE
jgi:pilus assembly protein FimV